jgi:4-amino-4-deoxy-L-arabinose transferase-like glycosyltransferase
MIVAVACLTMLLRVWLIFGYGSSGEVEVFEYDELARNLLAGRGYVYHHLGTDYQAYFSGVPYVAICAALYKFFAPGSTAVLLAQSLFSTLLTVVAWAIGREVWDDAAGLVGAELVALHPGLLFYDTNKLHPLSFDALTIALATLLVIRMRTRTTAWAAMLAGLTAGVAVLQRGTMILFVVFGLGWLWWVHRLPRLAVRQAVVFVAGTLLVLAPWITRNYAVFGTMVMSTNAAENFWVGNAPHSVGSS